LGEYFEISVVMNFSSSSSHTVPYSTADIVYGIENSHSDDVEGAQNSFVDVAGKESRISSSENTDSNVRHPSDRGSVRKSVSIEKGIQSSKTKNLWVLWDVQFLAHPHEVEKVSYDTLCSGCLLKTIYSVPKL
jgi:hypothetical protein